MLVRFFMSREVETLDPDLSCRVALERLRSFGCRRAPVVSGDRLLGIVTDRDLLRILPATLAQGFDGGKNEDSGARVREVMASEPVTVGLNDHIECAARRMLEHKIGGLPVLQGSRLVGMITESDIFKLVTTRSGVRGGERLTIHWTRAEEEPRDPVPLCYELGARLLDLTSVVTPGGETMMVLRVECEQMERLLERLESSGFTLVERDSS